MPRPRKQRRLLHPPRQTVFKPVGIPLETLQRVTLLHEELEALRLADLEGQHQLAAAKQMGVSRSTFQRVIVAARRKVAAALVEGLALQIEGGAFQVADTSWHCPKCGYDWGLAHGSGQGQPDNCPSCGNPSIEERWP